MEAADKKQSEAVTLPKCKFADDDNVECYGYCDHGVDERSSLLGLFEEILCDIDRKWHPRKHVCKYWK